MMNSTATPTTNPTSSEEEAPASWTPYQIAVAINTRLKKAGLPTIPTQMMYNYASKGLIKGAVHVPATSTSKSSWSVPEAKAQEFVDRFCGKREA